MEPQGKVWPGKSGRQFAITSPKMYQTLVPFNGIGEFSSDMKTYPHTLFRFPLRQKASGLSEKCYDISKLKELLEALKEEAEFLLVFLRSVVVVRVVEISATGDHSTIFEVRIKSTERGIVSEKRQSFLQDLKSNNLKQRKSAYRICYEAKFHILAEDKISGGLREKHWLVTATVGSDDPTELQAANKLKVLPWVGCALELDQEVVDDSGGRLFCFLPLPHETRSPLPIHVNGTFGLDDNRRSLKWPSRERKHDSTADWNMIIVKSLLPYCYTLLIKRAIEEGIPPHYVYASWPQCDKLRKTPWSGLMQPLFDLLFEHDSHVLWSTVSPEADTGKWISLQHATIITASDISPVLHGVLSTCGLQLVDFSDYPQIREALRVYNKKTTELSPALVRQTLRTKKGLEYRVMSPDIKHELLRYCLTDSKFSELEGLELLPIADGSFIAFTQGTGVHTCFVCSDKHHSGLLPGLMNRLVELGNECLGLQRELLRVAGTNKTQLQKLTPEVVANLLPHCMPPEWKNKLFTPISGSVLSRDWFKLLWEWVARYNLNLDIFEDKLVLPVVKYCSRESELCIAKLVKKSSVVSISEESMLNSNLFLMQGLEKFNVFFTGTMLFPYLHGCISLKEYVCSGTPQSVLSALRNAYSDDQILTLPKVKLTREEAEAIQQFIPEKQCQEKVVTHLPIFICENSSDLHSLASAAQESWGDKAIMLTSNSNSRFECSTDILPSNLLLLSPTYHQKRLVKLYPDRVVMLHWVDLVLHYLFPMIQSDQYPHSKLNVLMEALLDQLSSPKFFSRSSLVEKIRDIPFLKKDSKSALMAPRKMFDPSTPLLQDIVPAEMFPKKPFNKPSLLPQLRECGLRQALTAQEVLKVMGAISSKKTTTTEISRAKSLLEYLDRHKYLMNEKVRFEDRDVQLNKALQDVSNIKRWLPQLVKPPEYYPSNLPWKGKSYPALVSLGPETLVCSQKNLERDCMKVGSATCIVVCPDSVSTVLGSTLKVNVVVKHLKEVIKCYAVVDEDKVDAIMQHIYEFFQKKKESYPELKSSLPQNWIWMRKIPKFLSTKSLCLKRSANLQQDLEPYMYVLPESLQRFAALFKAMGVKETVTQSQLLGILASIKKQTDESEEDSEELWMSVMAILTSLTLRGKQAIKLKSSETLYVPTNSELLHLEDYSKVCYADYDFLEEFIASTNSSENECILCHDSIKHMAPQLHLTALSEHYELSEDLFEDFGPHEPLVLRLKNILRDYKDGLTIIKELLQNADDAGATEVNVCYDTREHTVNPKTLLYSGMSECNGPALVVHNDATFTDEDFQNITKLAAATKKDKPLKIGKFGVGFCSVYHITDIPCFVSREYLYIFDPTLQYLKQHISDRSRPGKRLNFTKKIATFSNQLEPFVGLFNFQSKKSFNGTMFRFPFRTSASEISAIQYTNRHIEQLRKDIQECGAKLLLFLQTVSRITFSHINEGDEMPEILLDICKETLQVALPHPDTQLLQVSTTCGCDLWLVSTYTEKTEFGGQNTDAVSSVAAQISKNTLPASTEVDQFSVVPLQGEVFCFLPLAVMSGLPVHVSANFAVQNDRSGIRTSEDHGTAANEAEWNVDLMKGAVPKAYVRLLLCLSLMHVDKITTDEYKCYTLLPLKKQLAAHNPWDFLIAPLYDFTRENRLLFSECTRSWLKVSEGLFLSPGILRSNQNDNQSVRDCIRVLKLPVIDIPSDYEAHLPAHQSLQELDFVKLFFERIEEMECHIQMRNDIIGLILLSYWYAQYYDKYALKEILRSNKCVPCTPDGAVLQYCHDVIDPNAYFADLYEPTDSIFPIMELRKPPTNQALIDLGMVCNTLEPSKILDRANTIQSLHSSNTYLALKRAKIVLKCLSTLPSYTQYQEMKSITFIPIQQRPSNYPKFINWKGDGYTLLTPDEIHYGEQCQNLAGSQVCIAGTNEPEDGGCGSIGQAVVSKLGMRTTPHFQHVVKHFQHIIQEVTSRQETLECTQWVTQTCSEIYQFLEDHLRDDSDIDLRELGNCVWTGSCFVSPDLVASEWANNGPYLFPVPATLTYKRHLLAALEIKDHFSVNTLVETLQQLKDEYQCNQIDEKCQDFLAVLLAKLSHRIQGKGEWRSWNCYLPDSNYVLRAASELDYDDSNWCNPNESGATYVHPTIPRHMAIAFGVRPIRAKLLDEYEDTFEGEEFGQVEEITQRIKNILEDYPLDVTVLKELLQNADDAKASKMVVILDKRFHETTRVPSDEWGDLQGPALLVWNDSTFSKKDLVGIQELGLGSKRSKSDTIGMYGIGFNVVYHLTDCPSFISTERSGQSTLCVFDPHCRYIPGAKKLKPGRRFNNLDDRFWGQWSDVASAYLRNDKELQEEVRFGSLFRFPLRCRKDLIDNSKLVDSSLPLEAGRMEELLMEWAPEMKEALFFLNNVTELKFVVIDNSTVSPLQHYKVTISAEGQQSRNRIQKRIHDFSENKPMPHLETYTVTLTESLRGKRTGEPKRWLIQQGIGDVEKPKQHWQFLPKMKPKHGIAAPLSATEGTQMRVFCFLPLPVMSHLPVHINGSFVLLSSRRQLWQPTTSRVDDKTKWNHSLLEAIASSYAHLLANVKGVFIPNESVDTETEQISQCVDQYYQTFPVWLMQNDSAPEGEYLRLAKLVYYKLYLRNESILVHLKESDECKHCVEFLPLLNNEDPSRQPYFYDREEESLNHTLRNIGMHLTEAPTVLYEHFHQLKIDLPRVTRESVFNFYSQVFSNNFITPAQISETKFESAENFKEFTFYILEYNENDWLEYPHSPFSLPLLLTADGNLRVFDQNDRAIRTEFSDLFSNSKEMFLHPELMDIEYDKDYFLKPSRKCEDVVQDILSSTLPSELKCETIPLASSGLASDTLTKLWECLSKEEFFLVHLKSIIGTWALIPSKTHDLYSLKCTFLPTMEDDCYNPGLYPYGYTPPPKYDKRIVGILKELGMPELNDTVIQKELAEKFCPKLSDAAATVKNLYYLHQKRNVLVNIAPSSVEPLLKYCGDIHLQRDIASLQIVKSLPLFRSIDDQLCSIENGAFIWPDKMCGEGKEVWLYADRHVFLKRDGEWTCLNAAAVLGIQNISHFKLYTTYIFPVFYKLTERQRLCHLEIIRDSLYDMAEQETKNVFLTNGEGKLFIQALQTLCFVPRRDGSLRPVSEFADPRQTILETFKHHFNFPLSVLRDDKWLDFLVKIGLHTSITSKEFLQFCFEVRDGKHSDLKAASHELTKYLFNSKEWHSDKYFLKQVSQIAFVCSEPLQKVTWIHKCAPSQKVIQQSSQTLNLTSLAEAADHEYYMLIWTVKPVVCLPSYPEFSFSVAKQKRKELLVSLNVSHVTVEDVVKNILNISSTKFSDFSNFENYSCDKSKDKDRISIVEVMGENLKFLSEHMSNASSVISPLKATPCIPVCAEGNIDVITHPVLVKPTQVIAQASESIREFMPFLNRLPNQFYSILPSVLSRIGVEQSIMVTHVQGALETVHMLCGEQKLDVNSVNAVKKLIRKLYELLQNSTNVKFPSACVLYLPNSDYVLVDSRNLLYQDSGHFRKTKLTFENSRYTELHLLVPHREIEQQYRFQMKDLCHQIPHDMAPKPLTRSCREVMSKSCRPEVSPSPQARSLQRACKLPLLVSAACAILKHQSNPPKICEKLEASLRHFFRSCEVVTVKNLTVDLWLKISQPEVCIGTAQVDFHIEKKTDTKICLYIDKEARKIFFYKNLSRAILAVAAEISGVQMQDIKEPENVLTHLLQAETSDEIQSTVREIGASDFLSPQEQGFMESEDTDSLINPVLGESIPEPWHYRLQQDYNNLFRPGEIVGYEIEENHVVFASIGYKVVGGDDGFVEYYIYLEEEEEEGKRVSVLDIYKIRRSVIQAEESGEIQDVTVYEGHRGEEEPVGAHSYQLPQNLIDIKKEICEELKKIWKLPDDMKRKAIKRMYLKWHPDKNLVNTKLAEEAFKFLKRQIERMEEGKPMEDPDEPEQSEDTTPQGSRFSSSFWESFFRTWDNTAHSHSHYQQKEWRNSDFSGTSHQSYPQSDPFGFSFFDPTAPDKDKARNWMRQAECDYAALSILVNSCNPDVCANICFLAHEVAEKAIKAGMLAVWGLRSMDFKNHKKIIDFAINLEQAHPQLSGLLDHVQALPTEKFYYKTRWPNWNGLQHAVPADSFDESTARRASDNAKAVLEMMKTLV